LKIKKKENDKLNEKQIKVCYFPNVREHRMEKLRKDDEKKKQK
jgi:hypothetical protein